MVGALDGANAPNPFLAQTSQVPPVPQVANACVELKQPQAPVFLQGGPATQGRYESLRHLLAGTDFEWVLAPDRSQHGMSDNANLQQRAAWGASFPQPEVSQAAGDLHSAGQQQKFQGDPGISMSTNDLQRPGATWVAPDAHRPQHMNQGSSWPLQSFQADQGPTQAISQNRAAGPQQVFQGDPPFVPFQERQARFDAGALQAASPPEKQPWSGSTFQSHSGSGPVPGHSPTYSGPGPGYGPNGSDARNSTNSQAFGGSHGPPGVNPHVSNTFEPFGNPNGSQNAAGGSYQAGHGGYSLGSNEQWGIPAQGPQHSGFDVAASPGPWGTSNQMSNSAWPQPAEAQWPQTGNASDAWGFPDSNDNAGQPHKRKSKHSKTSNDTQRDEYNQANTAGQTGWDDSPEQEPSSGRRRSASRRTKSGASQSKQNDDMSMMGAVAGFGVGAAAVGTVVSTSEGKQDSKHFAQEAQQKMNMYGQQARETADRHAHETRAGFDEAGRDANQFAQTSRDKMNMYGHQAKDNADRHAREARANFEGARHDANEFGQRSRQKMDQYGQQARESADRQSREASKAFEDTKHNASQRAAEARESADRHAQQARESADRHSREAGKAFEDAKHNASQRAAEARADANQRAAEARAGMEDAKRNAGQKANEFSNSFSQRAAEAKQKANIAAQEAKVKANQAANDMKEKANHAQQQAEQKVNETQKNMAQQKKQAEQQAGNKVVNAYVSNATGGTVTKVPNCVSSAVVNNAKKNPKTGLKLVKGAAGLR